MLCPNYTTETAGHQYRRGAAEGKKWGFFVKKPCLAAAAALFVAALTACATAGGGGGDGLSVFDAIEQPAERLAGAFPRGRALR